MGKHTADIDRQPGGGYAEQLEIIENAEEVMIDGKMQRAPWSKCTGKCSRQMGFRADFLDRKLQKMTGRDNNPTWSILRKDRFGLEKCLQTNDAEHSTAPGFVAPGFVTLKGQPMPPRPTSGVQNNMRLCR